MRLETTRGAIGVVDHGVARHGVAPLVLLHPFPFDRRAFDLLLPHLAEHRVLTVEAPGFGETPGRAAYSIADLADDVIAVLDAIGIARASVLGNSMGGYVALALGRRAPSRVERLLLVDTRANADGDEAKAARQAAIAAIEQHGAARYVEGIGERLLGPSAPSQLREMVKQLVQHPAASLIAALGALRDRPDRSRELGAIEHPTLVVCGALDSVTPPDVVRSLADPATGIKQARYVELPGVGHLPPLEAPAVLAEAINSFIAC